MVVFVGTQVDECLCRFKRIPLISSYVIEVANLVLQQNTH